MIIRKFRAIDMAALVAINHLLFPDEMPATAVALQTEITQAKLNGGGAWVILEDDPLGYLVVTPVPGLAMIGDLHGGILPDRQRQGLGSRLLHHVQAELRHGQFHQLAYSVSDLDSPAACFFRSQNFFVEHVEWVLKRPSNIPLPPLPTHTIATIRTFDRATAVANFCRLYEYCFTGLPWNQPFTPQEVNALLEDPAQIIFLELAGQLIGFAWLITQDEGVGVIEPLAIVPERQGEGYGRILLIYALQQLAQEGLSQIQIGTWRNNHPAIHLYHSLGFEHKETLTYLAYDL